MGEAQPGPDVTTAGGRAGATPAEDGPAVRSAERTAGPQAHGEPPAVGSVEATTAAPAHPDGLAAEVAAVEAARARFGHSLSQLEREARAQIGYTVERILWKVAAAGAVVAAGVAARKVMTVGWRAARKGEPPTNPASASTSWGEALAWAAALGLGMGVARLVAARGVAAGWQKATGSPPPD